MRDDHDLGHLAVVRPGLAPQRGGHGALDAQQGRVWRQARHGALCRDDEALEEWRLAAPEAALAITPGRLRKVREAAAAASQDLPTWGLRAAFVHELLATGDFGVPAAGEG